MSEKPERQRIVEEAIEWMVRLQSGDFGLFIGATRAREMRNAMLVAVAASLPLGWLLQGLGNHGLWLAFLAFMLLRGLVLAAYGWRLTRRDGWFPAQGADSGR